MLVAGRRRSRARRPARGRSTSARRSTRVLDETGEATLFSPLHADASRLDARAGLRHRSRPFRPAGVGRRRTAAATRLVDHHAERHAGVGVEHLTLAEALHRLASGPAGVVVAEDVLGEALSSAPRLERQAPPRRDGPALADRARALRARRRARRATSPARGSPTRARCCSRRRSCSRRASVASRPPGRRSRTASRWRSARRGGLREVSGPGVAATTREFVDAVLGLLPSARRDTEFALGVAR